MVGLLLFLTAGGSPFVVRDAWTGRVVSASVRSVTSASGTRYTVHAPGYRSLSFTLDTRKEAPSHVTVWLEPLTPPPFPEMVEGMLTVRGYVTDPDGKPLKGVWVNDRIRTDDEGSFVLRLPAGLPDHQTLPRQTLRFSLSGYRTLIREVLAVEGAMILKVTLQPGEGVDTVQELHGQGTGDFPPPEDRSALQTDLLIPPQVIRVGTNCSGRSCSSVQIMPLETYVRSGLDEEWIASWPTHSLRAGSVAYRTYGAWYTAHPISGTYDICNNTYCQVWDGSDVYASVVDAVKHTTGVLLSNNGAYAYSEYSAENNDCGCGDGYAGTGSSWPCIPDGVDAGHACFGHGRGMCQWGTSRWASQGKAWTWMADHYYEPGGYVLASPVGIVSVDAWPDTLEPGDTLTLMVSVISYAGDTLPHGMVGASLHWTVWVDDPPRDLPVTYIPGNQTFSRLFVLPDTLSEGSWQVYAGLWLDVDENGAINTSGGDLSLALQPGPTVTVLRRTDVAEGPSRRSGLVVRVMPRGLRLVSSSQRVVEIFRPDGRRVGRRQLVPGKVEVWLLEPGVYVLRSGKDVRRIVVP